MACQKQHKWSGVRKWGTRWVGQTMSHNQEDNASYSCHSICDVQLSGAEPLDRIRVISTDSRTSSGKGNITVYFM